MLHFRNKPLLPVAEEFLKEFSISRSPNTINLYRGSLHHFYRFLAQSKMEVVQLKINHIAEFDEDLTRHNLKMVTRRAIIQHVHLYLRALQDKGLIKHDLTKELFPNYRPDCHKKQSATLPETAEDFLRVLSATKEVMTVKGYQSCLRRFYCLHWLREKRPNRIDRIDIENFMINMNDRKVDANQRRSRLAQLRRYFDWLYEHKKLKTHPDDLVKHQDFPQAERKLPRPYPIDVDLEIQRRLKASHEIDWLGLLLLRRLGLRVGELRNITIDCIQKDLYDNLHLKVPMIKIKRERLMPIDPETAEIIERIKRIHSNRPEPGTDKIFLISNSSGKRRSRNHFAAVLQEVTKDLAINGDLHIHRLRHSFATTLLSAGVSLSTLKTLMGHNDIRMTLLYAEVTQETVRNEYFSALNKVQNRYEISNYQLKTPDLREGINRSFYDAQRFIKKLVKEHSNLDQQAVTRLLYRLNSLRHEFSVLLKL